jgi:hypothetical protein
MNEKSVVRAERGQRTVDGRPLLCWRAGDYQRKPNEQSIKQYITVRYCFLLEPWGRTGPWQSWPETWDLKEKH